MQPIQRQTWRQDQGSGRNNIMPQKQGFVRSVKIKGRADFEKRYWEFSGTNWKYQKYIGFDRLPWNHWSEKYDYFCQWARENWDINHWDWGKIGTQQWENFGKRGNHDWNVSHNKVTLIKSNDSSGGGRDYRASHDQWVMIFIFYPVSSNQCIIFESDALLNYRINFINVLL